MRLMMVAAVVVLLAGCQTESGPGADTSTDPPPADSQGVRLFLATGEYNQEQDWAGVLRFEQDTLEDASANVLVQPDGTVNLHDSSAPGLPAGQGPGFAHGLHYDDGLDALWLSFLFTPEATTCSMDQPCGSIGVLQGASSMDGPVQFDRHIIGADTGLRQPHGLWLDASRDTLYVANTFGSNILAWEDAGRIDGNVPPDRTISIGTNAAFVNLFVDEEADRLFAVNMVPPQVLVWNHASTLDGTAAPDVTIAGPLSRFSEGNNPTMHNIQVQGDLMFVAHHTNEVLIFDVQVLAWNEGSIDLPARVLRVNEQADLSDQYDWSVYGLFYEPMHDRLYVSAGHTEGGTAERSGPPGPQDTSSRRHAVKVYDNVSNSTVSGVVDPALILRWSNIDQYYPPQPVWVDVGPGPVS